MEKLLPRLNNITKLQTMAVFLVVLGHCHPISLDNPLSPYWQRYVHEILYTFNMPLFFVLAGFLFFYKFNNQEIDYLNFIKKKGLKLIVPYITLGSIGYLIKVLLFNKYAFRPATFSLSAYIDNFIYPVNNAILFYWFLPTLFIIFLLAPLLKKFYSYNKTSSIFLIFLSMVLYCFNPFRNVSLFNLSGVITYIFPFILGFWLCQNNQLIEKTKHKPIIIVVAFFILNILVFKLPPMYIIHLCSSIIGIAICFLSVSWLQEKKLDCLNFLDGKHYEIYLLSWFSQMPMRLLMQMGFLSYNYVFVLMLLAGLFMPIAAFKIIKKGRKLLYIR